MQSTVILIHRLKTDRVNRHRNIRQSKVLFETSGTGLVFVQGVFVRGLCPGVFVWGVFVLEPCILTAAF